MSHSRGRTANDLPLSLAEHLRPTDWGDSTLQGPSEVANIYRCFQNSPVRIHFFLDLGVLTGFFSMGPYTTPPIAMTYN